MNNSDVLQTSQSADLITHKVLIEGEELSGVHQVKSITVTKEANRIPTARIVLIDGEAATRDFALSNEDLFVPGKEIEITAGYHSDEATIFKGIVIKHNLKIRENSSQLIIECKDEAVKMTIGRKSRYHYDASDSDIFEQLLSDYGLEAEVESTNHQHAELVQFDVSDWDFMVTRAQANGRLCFVENGVVSIGKPNFDQEELETITFGSTLLDFDAEIDARHQVKKVLSKGWSHSDQEILEIEGSDPSLALNGNLTPDDLNAVIDLEALELRHGGAISDTELQDWADAKWLFQQLSKVRGTIKFQGLPEVKPNTVLNLQGVGDRFNGKVYITALRHSITEGNWVTTAQFGMDPEWFSERNNIGSPPASGLKSAINGLQIGVVSQLQDDPDGEERILVQLPIIDYEEQGIWCRWASLDAGEERGAYFLPEIGDEVIVGFINDDPNNAVVLGMLHSSTKPAPFVASDDNFEKGFITKENLKIWFNDEKKSIVVMTPGERIITMDDDAGSVEINDPEGNTIIMNSDGISMESSGEIAIKASQDLSLEGANVTIKGSGEFKAEGSSGAEISSSGTTTVMGSLVQIN